MAGKHRKTYEAIFADPVRANISWNDAVTLAEAFGLLIVPGGGSMFSFEWGGGKTVLHRPHPGNEMSRTAVRAFRKLLVDAGVNPDDL